MPKFSVRALLTRRSARRRLADLHLRARWATEARTAPTLWVRLSGRAGPQDDPGTRRY